MLNICNLLNLEFIFFSINVKDALSSLDSRFDFFVSEILPQYKDSIMTHTMIYVPSYFDYVRIRNYFKKEDISFVQICEYSKVTFFHILRFKIKYNV